MRIEYLAVYREENGKTVPIDLVKDPVTRGYRLHRGDGLQPIRWYLDGGLEFVRYELAPFSMGINRIAAEKFMNLLLMPPVKPKRRPETVEYQIAASAVKVQR
jgi:hypothetical protein